MPELLFAVPSSGHLLFLSSLSSLPLPYLSALASVPSQHLSHLASVSSQHLSELVCALALLSPPWSSEASYFPPEYSFGPL